MLTCVDKIDAIYTFSLKMSTKIESKNLLTFVGESYVFCRKNIACGFFLYVWSK